jgi:hypothetical protein
MIYDSASLPVDVQESRRFEWFERPRRSETPEWLNLLKVLSEPAAFIERALTAVDRIQRGMRQPRNTAAIGTNLPGLLATLALRLRGTEVVTVGPFSEPLLSPNRVKGIPGWKHVWLDPALATIPLVQDVGASYVCASQMSTDGMKERFGLFDVIIVTSAESAPVPDLTRGLSETGALIDLTLGNGIAEIWTANPTSGVDVKHQDTFRHDDDDDVHRERATRNLELADALYPGWLSRLMDSLEAPRPGCGPALQPEMSVESWSDGRSRIEKKEHEPI